MSREVARYTYAHGSRPEGCVVYDNDSKMHSHHDTDPARGQSSSFDLVRLHCFGHLDANAGELPMRERPSYKAMCEFANDLPEIRGMRAETEFEDLGELSANDDDWLDAKAPPAADDAHAALVKRFTSIPPEEFASGPPMDWLVRGVLPRAGLVVIYGESGSGKTFLTLDLMTALTRGIEWTEHRTQKCKVTYICAEGAGGFKARLRAYARGHECSITELPRIIADSPNFLSSEHPLALLEGMDATGHPDVVVIDVLSAIMPGGNENSGECVGLVIDYCKQIHRKTGALVVLIHHSGKDAAKGARGWSGLRAAVDAEIEVTRTGDYRKWTTSKMRDGKDDVTGAFKLKVIPLGFDAQGEEESSCIIEHVEVQKDVPSGKQRASGRHQIAMFDMLKHMAPSGAVKYDDLVAGYVAKMPKGNGCDNRRRDGNRALEELIAKKLAFMHSDDLVSLTSLITSTDATEF